MNELTDILIWLICVGGVIAVNGLIRIDRVTRIDRLIDDRLTDANRKDIADRRKGGSTTVIAASVTCVIDRLTGVACDSDIAD